MKYIYTILALFLTMTLAKAQVSKTEAAKKTVQDFFEAFHKQDTVALKAFTFEEVSLSSFSIDKEGKTVVDSSPYIDFVKSIGSIPTHITFHEELTDYTVLVDGPMAVVWTPYIFHLNGKISHTGVNLFQLILIDNEWKIKSLSDTRNSN